MRCHEIDYKIFGDDMQYVEIELDTNETVIAEAGAMMYMEQTIHFDAKLGDGSNPDEGFFSKIINVGKRMLTNESLFLTHFTHKGSGKGHVSFAAPYPGKIIPVDLSKTGGEIICQRDAFLCAALGTRVEVELCKKLGAGFFGGEGFILQRIEGDGMTFIHASGGIHMKKLDHETIKVDPGCIVGFTSGIDYDIQMAGNFKSMLFGGEGLFLATLSGSGYVWLQSLPFSRLADKVLAHAPTQGGNPKGQIDAGKVISSILRND